MVSIIIITYNNIKFTELCIESLLANTSQIKTPFEIIVVDNASKDGSVEYLKGLETSGQIKLILNNENVGYPKANNQAAKIAKGEYLCLLNNDTVLTEGWLEKLLRCIKSDSKISAVGPYTSHSSGYQQSKYKHEYQNQKNLNEFAIKFYSEEQYVDFLVFFCCLIKKSVWDEVGGLNEEYGLGNFDDNEFCWYAVKKGYKLKVCNAYIYHFGGASFGYKDPKKVKEFCELLSKNQKVFHRKIKQYKKISLCMIVAESEKPETLKRLLGSIYEWVDEINIIVNYKKFKWIPNYTKFEKMIVNDLVNPYNQKALNNDMPIIECNFRYEKWTDFSDMRNKSLELATGDYCIILDADDVVYTPQAIRDIILMYPDVDYFQCQVNSFKENGKREVIYQNRIFKNNPKFRYRNSAHEDISFSMLEQSAVKMTTNFTINHLGNMSFKDVQRKNLRNMELLLKDYKAGKAHSLTYFGLVNCYLLTQKKEDYLIALKLVDECFEKCHLTKDDPLTPKMWVLRGGSCFLYYRVTKEASSLAGARQSFLKAWDEWRHPEAAVSLAEVLMIEKDFDKAIVVLTELLKLDNVRIGNVPIDMEEVEVTMLGLLGDCWLEKSKDKTLTVKKDEPTPLQKAEEYYSKCLLIDRNNLYVADKLISVLHIVGKINEAAFLTCKFINSHPNYSHGWLNMGQYELMNKRYITAEVFLKRAVQLNPKNKEAVHNLSILEAMNKKRG
jgi:GT2 family glycosyltransferase